MSLTHIGGDEVDAIGSSTDLSVQGTREDLSVGCQSECCLRDS